MKVLGLREMVVEQLLSSRSSTEARWEGLVSKVQNNDSYSVSTNDKVLNPQGLQIEDDFQKHKTPWRSHEAINQEKSPL